MFAASLLAPARGRRAWMLGAAFAEMLGGALPGAETAHRHRRCALLLKRALGNSRFDHRVHLRIMRQAEAHVAACDYDEKRAVTCQGPGGDLLFVLRTYRDMFRWRVSA